MGSFFVKKLHLLRFISAASRRLTLPDGPSLGGATDGGLMADAQEAATSDSWRPVDHGENVHQNSATCDENSVFGRALFDAVGLCRSRQRNSIDQVLIDGDHHLRTWGFVVIRSRLVKGGKG